MPVSAPARRLVIRHERRSRARRRRKERSLRGPSLTPVGTHPLPVPGSPWEIYPLYLPPHQERSQFQIGTTQIPYTMTTSTSTVYGTYVDFRTNPMTIAQPNPPLQFSVATGTVVPETTVYPTMQLPAASMRMFVDQVTPALYNVGQQFTHLSQQFQYAVEQLEPFHQLAANNNYINYAGFWGEPPVETPEARAKREARAIAMRAAEAASDAAADALLRDVIGDDRFDVYLESQKVWVVSAKSPNLAYEVQPRKRIQLYSLNDDGEWFKEHRSLCIHPERKHPAGDEVAALVLLCQFNEDSLWKTANMHLVAA